MQYILTEKEYKDLVKTKEVNDGVHRLISGIYVSSTMTYEFNVDTYRALMRVLGNQYGDAYRVNVSGGLAMINKKDGGVQ